MASSKRSSTPSTATSSAASRSSSSTRSSSTAANQLSPPASRATLPSWPNGESTNAVGRSSVLVIASIGPHQADALKVFGRAVFDAARVGQLLLREELEDGPKEFIF